MVLLVIIFLSSCRYGTFATGGCDGFVNVWDGTNKKRLYQVDHAVVLLHWETSEMFYYIHDFLTSDCSTQSTRQALLLFHSVRMATCLLWRPATLTKTEKNRNTELLFYQVFAFINEVFIYLFTVVFFAFQA